MEEKLKQLLLDLYEYLDSKRGEYSCNGDYKQNRADKLYWRVEEAMNALEEQ